MSEFITIIRPSFMKFCKDACRAAAFNHLLFRIAGKSKDQPKEKIQAGDILWYAKTEQITEEMSDAWGTCKVRKEVNALISMGLIGRRSNPEWGADRTKHFCFGTEQCQKLLACCQEHHICIVHLGLPVEMMHLIYLSNANDKSIKCTCEKHQMEAIDISDANDTSIRAITIDSPTIDDNKESVSPSPEMTTNVSTLTPSEINNSSDLASRLPQCNDEKPIPPNPDKAQVNPSKKPGWERLLDYWDSKYGPGARPDRVVEKAKDMMERMKPTPEQVDKVCAELKARKKPVTFETMYNNWHLLKEVEEREKAQATPSTSSSIRGYTDYTHVKPIKPIRPMPREERKTTPTQKESPR